MDVVGAKPVAPVVGDALVLRRAGLRLDLAGRGAEAKVAAEFYFLMTKHGANRTPAFAHRAMNPVIESPGESIHTMLGVRLAETGQQRFALVATAVAIGIL